MPWCLPRTVKHGCKLMSFISTSYKINVIWMIIVNGVRRVPDQNLTCLMPMKKMWEMWKPRTIAKKPWLFETEKQHICLQNINMWRIIQYIIVHSFSWLLKLICSGIGWRNLKPLNFIKLWSTPKKIEFMKNVDGANFLKTKTAP